MTLAGFGALWFVFSPFRAHLVLTVERQPIDLHAGQGYLKLHYDGPHWRTEIPDPVIMTVRIRHWLGPDFWTEVTQPIQQYQWTPGPRGIALNITARGASPYAFPLGDKDFTSAFFSDLDQRIMARPATLHRGDEIVQQFICGSDDVKVELLGKLEGVRVHTPDEAGKFAAARAIVWAVLLDLSVLLLAGLLGFWGWQPLVKYPSHVLGWLASLVVVLPLGVAAARASRDAVRLKGVLKRPTLGDLR
ncbi:hypothetical protein GCM10009599_19100 [Luteococcus peritonei]